VSGVCSSRGRPLARSLTHSSYRYVLLTRRGSANNSAHLRWRGLLSAVRPQRQQLRQLRRRRAQMANIWWSYQSRPAPPYRGYRSRQRHGGGRGGGGGGVPSRPLRSVPLIVQRPLPARRPSGSVPTRPGAGRLETGSGQATKKRGSDFKSCSHCTD